MPARGMNYGRGAKTVPYSQSMAYATGQTFLKGALVVDNANGEVVECGADPAAILGIAMQAAGTGPGYGVADAGSATVFTGRAQEVVVAIADRTSQFTARGVNGGTDPVLPLLTHIGEQYGVTKVGSDWVIDFAKTAGSARVEITDIVEAQGGSPGFFVFKILEAYLARP
jgi:hypothetical protein